MATGILASEIVRPKPLEKAAYPIAASETAAAAPAGGAQQPAALEPIEPLLAKADPARGQQIAKVCLQCHTFDKGGPNKIGPNLFGSLEEPMASVPNYQFSTAMLAHKGEQWTPDKLNEWLFKPQDLVKGTKMTFPGLPKAQDRADVIAYLESLK
ncbi:MAG: cytochrome c family protein [Alphaproteobacteria bacterium]|nr:cytochrome c family protein [Alphaproteobacteria bacterium]